MLQPKVPSPPHSLEGLMLTKRTLLAFLEKIYREIEVLMFALGQINTWKEAMYLMYE